MIAYAHEGMALEKHIILIFANDFTVKNIHKIRKLGIVSSQEIMQAIMTDSR